jgi:23S rRNA pseudouridine2604 synthase
VTARSIIRKPAAATGDRTGAGRSTRAKFAERTRRIAASGRAIANDTAKRTEPVPVAVERKPAPKANVESRAPRAKPPGKPYASKPASRERPSPVAKRSPPPPVAAAPAPVQPAEERNVRVSKLMSERGLCSRREADEYIERGWVYVDGKQVEELGTRIDPLQVITLDKKVDSVSRVTILLHKPIGFVSGQPEPGYVPAVTLILPDNRQAGDNPAIRFERNHLKGLAPAGRLDIDSTGLLVFTQDGRMAKLLIGDDSPIEKEYAVRVEGKLDDKGLALLNHGLSLDGAALRPARVSWQSTGVLRFVLREGKKRQIRRMCELVGLNVTALKRIRIGRVPLGDLPPGQWRYLRPQEKF